jgi:opine dehydrogenase
MEIAVLGGGHGCYAAAVEMSENGHRVRLWRRDKAALKPIADAGGIAIRDRNGSRTVPVTVITSELDEAINGADLVVIPLPSLAHDVLAARTASLFTDGQVVFLPPGTFGSYIFAKAMTDAGNTAQVAFCETGTLPYLARKHSPTEVVVSGYATRLPTGVFPSRLKQHAFEVVRQAYPAVEESEDALSGALMNAGPIIHPPLIIMNAGPLEHFDIWDIHNEGTQPAIRQVTTDLDNERIAIREALGYKPPHFPLSDHYSDDGDEWMYGRRAHDQLTDSGDWREHIDLKTHRYMLEDTRLGLSFLVSVGRWTGVPTPVAQGLLSIASSVACRDLYAEGRTLENLGLAVLSREEMRVLLETGLGKGLK